MNDDQIENDLIMKKKRSKKQKKIKKIISDDELSSDDETDISNKTKMLLKQQIVQWMDYDDTIRSVNNKLKETKKMKKKKEQEILETIEKHEQLKKIKMDIRDDETEDLRGRISYGTSRTKKPITEKTITGGLKEIFGENDTRIQECLEKIESKRGETVRTYLKRTKGSKVS